jgi:hypothetical protein
MGNGLQDSAASVNQANTTLEKFELKSSSLSTLSLQALANQILLHLTALVKFIAVLLSAPSPRETLLEKMWAI